jgi:hypothetical protein
MHGFHALRGLHGEGRDCRDAIAVMGGNRLEVGGYARSTGRIKAGDNEHNRWGDRRRMIAQVISLATSIGVSLR